LIQSVYSNDTFVCVSSGRASSMSTHSVEAASPRPCSRMLLPALDRQASLLSGKYLTHTDRQTPLSAACLYFHLFSSCAFSSSIMSVICITRGY